MEGLGMSRLQIIILSSLGAGVLAGCTAAAPGPVASGAVAPVRVAAIPPRRAGDPVMGRTARELEMAFGPPRATLVEGIARRLQFAGAACVLDAYLYADGGREPAVTHVDTRRPTGEDIDRAACVAALRVGDAAG